MVMHPWWVVYCNSLDFGPFLFSFDLFGFLLCVSFWSGSVALPPGKSSSFPLPSGSSFSKPCQDHVTPLLDQTLISFYRRWFSIPVVISNGFEHKFSFGHENLFTSIMGLLQINARLLGSINTKNHGHPRNGIWLLTFDTALFWFIPLARAWDMYQRFDCLLSGAI